MFCSKCGTKALDNAVFCQKCGAKLILDDTLQHENTKMPVGHIETPVQNIAQDTPEKKKAKKLPMIVGGIVLMIAVIVFIALNWAGRVDYEATVRAYTPFAKSEDMPYTCGEVFDKYLSDAKWEVRNLDHMAYVDITGIAKGTEKELSITMQVEVEDERASIDPVSVEVDGIETATQKETEYIFFALFVAYDENYEDLSMFAELDRDVEAVLQKENTENISNEIYGADVFSEVLNEYAGYTNDGTYRNSKYVFYDIDGNGVDELLVFYEDGMDGYTDIYTYADGTTHKIGEFWSRKRLLLDEEGNFYMIGSNSASNSILELAHISADGTALVTIETWEMNGPIYTHTTAQNKSEVISESEYQAVSDQFYNRTTEFVDSLNWQPLAPAETSEAATGDILYGNRPAVSFLGISMEELYPILGMPIEGPMVYEGTEYYLYDGIEFSGEAGYVDYIRGDASLLTVNGTTLDKDRAGIIEILGEPVLEEEMPGFEEDGIDGYYVMEYMLQEYRCVLRIELPDANGVANSVTLSWYEA